MYAVVIKERISVPGWDPRDPTEWVDRLIFRSFLTKDLLINFIVENNARGYGRLDVQKVIEYTELKVETTISVR